jgi:threonine/homoserine/homoserine lactone efflux protein
MVNLELLVLFIPAFALASITPGMCMTLSLSLGMSIGVKRTLWMMLGELSGVALVAVASVVGATSLLLASPMAFNLLALVGALYLINIGVGMAKSHAKFDLQQVKQQLLSPRHLIAQGFVTATSNPKGWAFFVALMPPFIDQSLPLISQMAIYLTVVIAIEFTSLLAYASGGQFLKKVFQQGNALHRVMLFSGIIIAGIGFLMAYKAAEQLLS